MTQATSSHLKWFFLGWVSILLLKYVVIGITEWNNVFHPGLIPAPNQQAFLQPFFGIFSSSSQG